ncbi:MAG: chitobiase/beta-hexosaminidase C-terminal domain-containing protein, partial [Kiritimatiellae bacterium]|nr:chitobiase/beta-hexosaminidase C-terminal domain-containing protein [Kiritimatiellia bacterium]
MSRSLANRLFVVLGLILVPALPLEAAQVAMPTFSVPHGFYDSPITVTLRTATSGARIRYTTDGSKPTASTGTDLASGGSVTINRTTPLRAIGYLSGWTASVPFTQTYLFPADILTQTRPAGYPTMWTSPGWPKTADYDMDPTIVNHASYKDHIKADLKAIPSVSIVMPKVALFGVSGGDDGLYMSGQADGGYKPEFECSAELIYPGRSGFQINCGIKTHTGSPHKRSLRLLFKSNYGSAQTLNYPFYQDAPLNAGTAAGTFGKIFLRHGNNECWSSDWLSTDAMRKVTFLRDGWMRHAMIAMTGKGGRNMLVHLYLNGLYWGLYDADERPDARFAADYLGGNKADWYAINMGGTITGNASRYNYLHNTLVPAGGFANSSTYNTVKQYVDVQHFCDYMMVHWYAGVTDWPLNNWYAVNRNNPAGPLLYMVWDQDCAWNTDHGGAWIQTWIYTPSADWRGKSKEGALWRALDDNRDFMTLFADRVYQHCFNSGALTEANSKARWDALVAYADPAIVCESARWGDLKRHYGGDPSAPTFTRDGHWRPACAAVRNMMTGNVGRFINVLRNNSPSLYPSVDPPSYSQYGGTVAAGCKLTLSSPTTTIYYTTDGSDPRLSGGGIASSATAYSGPITLAAATRVKSRIYKSTSTWSALADASFTVTGSLPPVAIQASASSVTVPEGGTATFQLRLAAQPASSVTVTTARSAGDSSISVSGGGTLSFTTSNWNTYQTVTLAAAEDNGDNANGTATITCSGSGLTAASVTATEADDDYTLTISASNGTVSKNPSSTYYDNGTSVQLTATPNAGYTFTGWSGALSGTANPASLTMNANKSVTANFAAAAQPRIAVSTTSIAVSFVQGQNAASATFQVWNGG